LYKVYKVIGIPAHTVASGVERRTMKAIVSSIAAFEHEKVITYEA
jgi:hypothetical protein